MTIRRTMDATLFNQVANDPLVRPWLGGGMDTIDLGPAFQNPAIFAFETKGGGFWLHPLMPGMYELHSLFLPRWRGKPMFEAAREMLRYMFTQTDCLEIVTKCPDDNGGARMAAARVGFRQRFRREDVWAQGVGVSYQVFSVDDWFVRDEACLSAGRAFHEILEAAKVAAGRGETVHPDDEAHDRAVGAAWLMTDAGQMEKGVSFYNRWSLFAGYATIAAVGVGTVDIRDAIVCIKDGQTEVLLCR